MVERCFIIAEAGVNHNGSIDRALALIDAAAAARANAVKFQTFKAERLASPLAQKAEYQKVQTGEGDQLSMLKALELREEDYPRLIERSEERGIEFMSTPFDEEAADFLVRLGIKRLKVPSGELTNLPYLAHLARFRLPIILSTGMGTLAEIEEAVETIRGTWRSDTAPEPSLTVLHCTSNYPTAPHDVNLRAMRTLADRLELPIGYSDHTVGLAISLAAVALGATVIEKHFTLDRSLPGPDHRASLEPDELTQLVREARDVEQALGSGEKTPRASELPVRDVARRSVTLVRDRRAGDAIARSDLALLRPGNGIPPKSLDRVVGRRAIRDLPAGTSLQWTDLA